MINTDTILRALTDGREPQRVGRLAMHTNIPVNLLLRQLALYVRDGTVKTIGSGIPRMLSYKMNGGMTGGF